MEGLRNKIETNSGVRSKRFYRSSTRLLVFGSALFFGEVFDWAPDSTRDWSVFLAEGWSWNIIFPKEGQTMRTYCGRSLFFRNQAVPNKHQSSTARSYVSCGGKRMLGNTMEREAWWQGTSRSSWWRVRSRAERIRCFLHIVNTESTHLSTSISVVLYWISAAVLDISRKATAVKERADFIGRLHSCTQNPRLSSCKFYCKCMLAVLYMPCDCGAALVHCMTT